MPSKTPQIAIDIINKEKEEKTGVLNLNNCGLAEWPEEIFEMEWLDVLIIGKRFDWDSDRKELGYYNFKPNSDKNQLKHISKFLGSLHNLKVLSLDNNHISKIENLENLINLKILNLSNNN